jgi:hypothetical protein
MTLYKLISIAQYYDTLKYRVRYCDEIVHVIKDDKDYIIEEWGNIVRPIFDSTTNKLVGFIDA